MDYSKILMFTLAVVIISMIYSAEAKPTNSESSNPQALEEIMELEGERQPSFRYINRAYDNSEAASKRQLKAYAESGVPRNAMEMMRALIALRRYRR